MGYDGACCISANIFRRNYPFLNLNFGHSTYRCGNYSREETIRGNTVYDMHMHISAKNHLVRISLCYALLNKTSCFECPSWNSKLKQIILFVSRWDILNLDRNKLQKSRTWMPKSILSMTANFVIRKSSVHFLMTEKNKQQFLVIVDYQCLAISKQQKGSYWKHIIEI